MDENPINPSETVTDAPDVSAAEGTNENDGLTLEDINAATGRQYDSKEKALQALKETYSYVGDAPKTKQELEDAKARIAELTQAKPNKADEVAELKKTVEQLTKKSAQDAWYQQNAEYIPYRDLISKLGDNPAEVVADDANKQILEALKLQSETTQKNTVMDSNSQPSVSDDQQKAFEKAIASGDWSDYVRKYKMPTAE